LAAGRLGEQQSKRNFRQRQKNSRSSAGFPVEQALLKKGVMLPKMEVSRRNMRMTQLTIAKLRLLKSPLLHCQGDK
jgi:hypothetical protein